MITDKQRQRDYEFDGDYQTKSRYTTEQWTNILNSGQISEENMLLLSAVYSAYNHAATTCGLAYHNKITMDEVMERINGIGQTLAEVNSLNPEVDFNGNEYWWYLCFWGKSMEDGTFMLKMQPELTEAIGNLFPESEQSYYAFMNDVDRSLQSRFNQEDSVWIAAAVLLYEKYYTNPGISADDILLMQYEVQTRAQKVYGQDVNVNTITQICNADERGHRFNYLRDIYKYYRVAYPGEFENEKERPDPETVDYNTYIYSIFGYMTLNDLMDFIEHEYAHLVDESYIEMNSANGFVRMADYLTRQGGSSFDPDDTSDGAIALSADGLDCETTFHMLADALIKEYPNFVYAKKASWFDEDSRMISSHFEDILFIESYQPLMASIMIRTVIDGDNLPIEISLNLPEISNEEVMLDIKDKCDMLTLMTAAPFLVEKMNAEPFDLNPSGSKIKASVLYSYDEIKTMKEEDIVGMLSTAMEIFASYYTDICQNYYPASEETSIDPFAEALGSKLVYRQGADVPGPNIIYKEGATAASTDFITQALQNYGKPSPPPADQTSVYGGGNEYPEMTGENADVDRPNTATSSVEAANTSSAGSASVSDSPDIQFTENDRKTVASNTGFSNDFVSPGTNSTAAPVYPNTPVYPKTPVSPKVPVSTHADRTNQSFRLYPKNTLIQGPVKTGKYHEAIITAVGIIEGKDSNMMNIEPVPDILEHYKDYVEENRILHISYPDINSDGYDSWMESAAGVDGIFKEFANRCGEGRYVVMMEEVDLNWMHLFGEASVLLRENRKEGTSSETAITLRYSKEKFKMPSNLYIVATCDSIVCEDTILGAIHHDFFIRHISPDATILHGMRLEGISLERVMSSMNLRISYFLGENYQLGEGFFLESADKDPFISFCRVFREQIIPVLESWFDGDIEHIRYVLGDNAKKRSDTIFYQEMPFREGLFLGTLPDSFDTERVIYKINESAFFNPKSYIDIYEM